MIVKIQNKTIGENSPPFIIAEAGLNHNGSYRLAKKLITLAKDAGADAVKFQTFKAEDLTSKKSKHFKMFKNLELSDSSFLDLSKFAKKKKIIFLSTPFSEDAVDLLEECNCPAFKIASGDLTNLPLIKHIAEKRKPVILSTGMGTFEEIKSAINMIRRQKNNQIILLHSVSGYPTPPNEVNLNSIPFLKKKFSYPIGYSDNGANLLVPQIAIALGAKVIEKHLTFNKKAKGPDHAISANKKELNEIIKNIKLIHNMFGKFEICIQECEKTNRIYARRSLVATTTIPKNTVINKDMISIKRPSLGIDPADWKKILKKKTKKRIKAEEPIRWKDLK